MSSVKKKPQPHPVDVFAGKRVRELRLDKGWTLQYLAKETGVRFQQIQKYQSAQNRISASRLYLICEALDTTILEFFSKLYSRRKKKGRTMKMLESPEAVKLARLFFKMSPGKRQRFYELSCLLVKKRGSKAGNATIVDKPATFSDAHPVDVYAGKQIWKFRIVTNTTQKQLAEKIGVGGQQAHKYEESGNRVSVSTLYLICETLGVSIPEFFEELYRKQKKQGIMQMLESKEGAKLVGLFFKMSLNNRKLFINFGKSLMKES